MAGHKPYSMLRDKMSEERRRRSEAKAKEILAKMAVADNLAAAKSEAIDLMLRAAAHFHDASTDDIDCRLKDAIDRDPPSLKELIAASNAVTKALIAIGQG